MPRRVKWAVIGLGWFGEKHCEALTGLPNAELYAVCTRTKSRLNEVASKFGVEHIYTDYRELLDNPEVEAVSITTMWDQHTAPSLASIEAGKHVFLEKPMASKVEDCAAIVRAVNSSDKFFIVRHVRFNPRYAAAKREIESGAIGKVVSLYARRNIPAAVGAQVLQKIGPIIGDGVHDTDLMLWYTGASIETAYAQSLNVRGLKYPDLGWTLYRFDSGAIGVCENIWFLPDKTAFQIDERMEIIGTRGFDPHPGNSPRISRWSVKTAGAPLTPPTGPSYMACALAP